MPEQQQNDSVRKMIVATTERSVRGAALVSLLLLSALAWSQESQTAQRAASVAAPPFAEVNESISQTANVVLASAAQADSALGTPNHSEASVVKSVIRYDPQSYSRSSANLKNALSRLASLRPVIEPILREAGIPSELAAVVIVESGGDPMALSPKGARGLWQLMPETARRYGLIVDNTEDDRLDMEKSTHVAARYLSDLYFEFGSWPLALAAYNTGEQNLQHAIDRSRSTDFNVLSSLRLLPLETRNYVPAVLAAATRLTNVPAVAQNPILWERNAQTVFAVTERSN
jgi:membrane-bound lytic murein transglycosylase D